MTVPRDPEAWARLGRQIRNDREEAGLSRRALAEKAGVSEKSIQVAEEGRVPRGRMPQSLARIEEALNWFPGAHLNILNGKPWAKHEGTAEVEIEIETEASHLARQQGQQSQVRRTFEFARNVEVVQSGYLAQDTFMRQAKRYRTLLGVSLADLERKLAEQGAELTAPDLEDLEKGMRLLRMTEAEQIASALGTTVDWILGSGFSEESPDQMRQPPSDEEMEAEANAVMRRMADVGTQVTAARRQAMNAKEREISARHEAAMAEKMLQSAIAQQRELEKHYQYLLGRIDSIRASRGEETVIQMHPVFEDDAQ